MFAIAARRMGYRVHTFSPESGTPTGQVADHEVTAPYEDLDAVRRFARGIQVVTFEFENVPAATVGAVAEIVPVRPRGEVLRVTQNRLREKTFLAGNGFPVTCFRHIKNIDDLHSAVAELGTPCILKTAGFGYDGKGQSKIRNGADIAAAFEKLGGTESVLEAFVDFEKEVSVVAARDEHGNFANYGVIENSHADHILDISFAPAAVPEKIRAEAIDIAYSVLRALDVVGVMCVEFFLTKKERLLINELAPRPHNSGHLTIDACITSQFEQQLRAVCGLPLGSTELLRPAAMANLLGDLWQDGEPNWPKALELPNVKLHLYGKAEPRPGRKMGHLTALAETVEEAVAVVKRGRSEL
jgi:5-(carboxyamino)imidazole ribonucleotide synthase